MNSTQLAILFVLAWAAFVSLCVIIFVYGFFTPWWRSRTGIGFMSAQLTLWLMLGLTLLAGYGVHMPFWVAALAWVLEIAALNWGITFNIIYKQFIEKRSDVMEDKNVTIKRSNNV